MVHLEKQTRLQQSIKQLQKMGMEYTLTGNTLNIRGIYEWTYPKSSILNLVNQKRLSSKIRLLTLADDIKFYENKFNTQISPSNYRQFEKMAFEKLATDYKGSEEHKQDILNRQQEREDKQKNAKIKKDQMVKDFAQQLINKGLKPDVTSSLVKYRGYKYQVRVVHGYELEEMSVNGKPWKKSSKLFIKEILKSKILPPIDQEKENTKNLLDLLKSRGFELEEATNGYKYKNVLFHPSTMKYYDGTTKSSGEGLSGLLQALNRAKGN